VFLYLHITDAGQGLVKAEEATYTLQWWLAVPLKAKCLYITVAFGPLWKQGIYTLQLLLGAPLKAK